MRPITGRGSARSCPAADSRPEPPIVTAKEGSRSTGSAPDPIWLRHDFDEDRTRLKKSADALDDATGRRFDGDRGAAQ